jgi:hypothetical protein
MIWFGDGTGARYVSSDWCALTGQRTCDAEGWGWLEAVDPDHRDLLRCTQTKAAERAVSFSCLYRLKLPRKRETWIATAANPCFDNNSKFIGFAGTAIVLSKRPKSPFAHASLGSSPSSSEWPEPTTMEKVADHILAARSLLGSLNDKQLRTALDMTLTLVGFQLAREIANDERVPADVGEFFLSSDIRHMSE